MALAAYRYARALADAAGGQSSRIEEDLRQFEKMMAESKDLREVLLDPSLAAKKRIGVVEAIAQRAGMQPKSKNLLAVLIDHERLKLLSEILERYRAECDRRAGIFQVEVTAARQLDGGEKAELEKQAAALAGGAVRAAFREDRSLIGGVVVRIGSTVYDDSIRGRLDRLRARLTDR